MNFLLRKPPSNFKIWAPPLIILSAMFLSTLRLSGIIAVLFVIVLVYYVRRLHDWARQL